MLPSRRKKIRFQVPPSDNELWAIGLVAVLWSQLESIMIGLVHALTTKDSAERATFHQTRSFEQRSDQWKALVESQIKEPNRSTIISLIGRARNAQQMRDRIMHAAWAGKPGQGGEDLTAKSVFNWNKPRTPFEWDLDFGKLMHVAQTVDAILVELLESTGLVALSAARAHGSVTMLDDALQHIRRTPSPNP